MQSNHKVIHLIVCGMIWLGALSFFPESAFSQAESATQRALAGGGDRSSACLHKNE